MSQVPYFDLHTKDGSGVSFEHWTDSRSVALHRHGYYELFLIEKGSCSHMFQGTETLLVPGDAVLVPPHSAHGFSLSGEISIFNCQFIPEAVGRDMADLLGGGLFPGKSEPDSAQRTGSAIEPGVAERSGSAAEPGSAQRTGSAAESGVAERSGSAAEPDFPWEHLLAEREDYYGTFFAGQDGYTANSSKQGVIHLNPHEFTFTRTLLAEILEDQEENEALFALKKKKYTEVILIGLCQALRRQNQIFRVSAGERHMAVADILLFMEENLTEPLDFDSLAEQFGFSVNYLRKLFRDATGLSPVKYLNRLRITRACAYMQQEHLSAREAAERVGFVDMNYFSRTFKQVMGCSPSRI